MRLQAPDQLSTLLIWLSAIFMALKTGMDQLTPAGREPMINLGGYWGFLPLALVLLAAVISIFRSTGGGAPPDRTLSAPPVEPWLNPQLRYTIILMLTILVMTLGYRLMDTFLPEKPSVTASAHR